MNFVSNFCIYIVSYAAKSNPVVRQHLAQKVTCHRDLNSNMPKQGFKNMILFCACSYGKRVRGNPAVCGFPLKPFKSVGQVVVLVLLLEAEYLKHTRT